jgi:hypothetical protein
MCDTWAWISGWAICPERFKAAAEKALPQYEHIVLAPKPRAVEQVLATGATRIGGYSLGSLLLLDALPRFSEQIELTCLAPFTAFCAESQRGGTTPRATLQLLQARLSKQHSNAIKLFSLFAGLCVETAVTLPYAADDLSWGLQQLASVEVNRTSLQRAKGLVGLTDPLVRATVLQSEWAHCILSDTATHRYDSLLAALQEHSA